MNNPCDQCLVVSICKIPEDIKEGMYGYIFAKNECPDYQNYIVETGIIDVIIEKNLLKQEEFYDEREKFYTNSDEEED